jgi:hypothetical protein
MTQLFMLDVPEHVPIVAVAEQDPQVTIDRVGPYFRIAADVPIVIDYRATGCRPAVWYSSVAGLVGSRITQWDRFAMRIESS